MARDRSARSAASSDKASASLSAVACLRGFRSHGNCTASTVSAAQWATSAISAGAMRTRTIKAASRRRQRS